MWYMEQDTASGGKLYKAVISRTEQRTLLQLLLSLLPVALKLFLVLCL